MQKAKLLQKRAYGWDQKGEVLDSQPMNIEDTSTPMSQHKTPENTVNTSVDSEAGEEYPWLGEHMHRFPGRGRN